MAPKTIIHNHITPLANIFCRFLPQKIINNFIFCRKIIRVAAIALCHNFIMSQTHGRKLFFQPLGHSCFAKTDKSNHQMYCRHFFSFRTQFIKPPKFGGFESKKLFVNTIDQTIGFICRIIYTIHHKVVSSANFSILMRDTKIIILFRAKDELQIFSEVIKITISAHFAGLEQLAEFLVVDAYVHGSAPLLVRTMFDEAKTLELARTEDFAYFKGDLVLSLPRGSYTAEEMWEVAMEMLRTSIAIQDEMRRHFESLPGLDQIRLFDALVASGVRSWEWWFNVLLADEVSGLSQGKSWFVFKRRLAPDCIERPQPFLKIAIRFFWRCATTSGVHSSSLRTWVINVYDDVPSSPVIILLIAVSWPTRSPYGT